VLRTRYADDAAARMVANALSVDPEVCVAPAPLAQETGQTPPRLLTLFSLCRVRQLTPDRVQKTLTVKDGTLVACVSSPPGPQSRL
jgi:hypothetical protein